MCSLNFLCLHYSYDATVEFQSSCSMHGYSCLQVELFGFDLPYVLKSYLWYDLDAAVYFHLVGLHVSLSVWSHHLLEFPWPSDLRMNFLAFWFPFKSKHFLILYSALQIQLQLEPIVALIMQQSHFIVSTLVVAEIASEWIDFVPSFEVLAVVFVFTSPSTLKSADEFVQIRFFDIHPKTCLETLMVYVLAELW